MPNYLQCKHLLQVIADLHRSENASLFTILNQNCRLTQFPGIGGSFFKNASNSFDKMNPSAENSLDSSQPKNDRGRNSSNLQSEFGWNCWFRDELLRSGMSMVIIKSSAESNKSSSSSMADGECAFKYKVCDQKLCQREFSRQYAVCNTWSQILLH